MGSADKNVALVFGASGISGWAVTNNLLSYPSATTFSRVVGLTNRPMDPANSQLSVDDARLELYSGLNLRGEQSSVIEYLKTTVPNIEDVTHVYYLAYSNATAYSVDVMQIRDINVHMTGNAVRAVDEVCKSLKFFLLQTGTNHYGVAVFGHQDKIDVCPPLKESQPRIPSPYGDEIFYYPQVDLIKEINDGKNWKWCEVRPDAIVGFTPGSTGMTFLEPQALFLALWRYVYGHGAEVPFLGTDANYKHLNTDSSHDVMARSEIYLSVTKPQEAHGEAFNIADYATPTSWVTKWPILAGWFGLKGVPPVEPAEDVYPAEKWWNEHREDYKRMCAEHGLRERDITSATWTFMLYAGHSLLRRDRYLCLDKIRNLGFTEDHAVGEGHFLGYERMVAGKILPPKEALQRSK